MVRTRTCAQCIARLVAVLWPVDGIRHLIGRTRDCGEETGDTRRDGQECLPNLNDNPTLNPVASRYLFLLGGELCLNSVQKQILA